MDKLCKFEYIIQKSIIYVISIMFSKYEIFMTIYYKKQKSWEYLSAVPDNDWKM